jgi:chaperonin cofactor prefoldin
MDTDQAAEAQQLIQRIQQLATDIEQVPNFGPDLGSMRKIDKECQEIRQHCARLSVLIGSGDAQRRVGGFYPNTGQG